MTTPLHIHGAESPRSRDPQFFGRSPQSSCNDRQLVHSDKTVLSVLAFLARRTHPIVMATQKDVAQRSDMTVRNLQLCYNRLEKAGWIERQNGPRNWCTPTQITLLFELRGFELHNDPEIKRVQKRTKAQAVAPVQKRTKAQAVAPTKAQAVAPSEGGYTLYSDLRESNKRDTRGGTRPRTPRQPNFFDRLDQRTQEAIAFRRTPEFQAEVDELSRQIEGDPGSRDSSGGGQ